MSREPAATPPPGEVPNLVNPSSTVHAWVSVTQYLCIPIVTIFVVMRMYVKILLHEFYFEDCTSPPFRCSVNLLTCSGMCLISWVDAFKPLLWCKYMLTMNQILATASFALMIASMSENIFFREGKEILILPRCW